MQPARAQAGCFPDSLLPLEASRRVSCALVRTRVGPHAPQRASYISPTKAAPKSENDSCTSSNAATMSGQFSQHQLRDGVVLPAVLNKAPAGTKAHVICLGYLQADAGWFKRGGNTSLMSNPSGPEKPERRDLIMYSVLIEHPTEGLILWETGCGKDYPGTSSISSSSLRLHC
ncbi:hypothetical protein L1887_49743 [Cichorium endivia]|nr:hypothetical protein L1887_49743 [Cichorium endivia]